VKRAWKKNKNNKYSKKMYIQRNHSLGFSVERSNDFSPKIVALALVVGCFEEELLVVPEYCSPLLAR
jgi:hypothetical protein